MYTYVNTDRVRAKFSHYWLLKHVGTANSSPHDCAKWL